MLTKEISSCVNQGDPIAPDLGNPVFYGVFSYQSLSEGDAMPITHAASRLKLDTCHIDLQRVVYAASDRMPLIVVCGHRGKEEQNFAFTTGKSQLPWPFSKHNKLPSEAVDCAPLGHDGKLDWNNIDLFRQMVAVFKEEATRLKIPIKCGADWQRFKDWPHFELAGESRNADDNVA